MGAAAARVARAADRLRDDGTLRARAAAHAALRADAAAAAAERAAAAAELDRLRALTAAEAADLEMLKNKQARGKGVGGGERGEEERTSRRGRERSVCVGGRTS